jgi:hypothetical protein
MATIDIAAQLAELDDQIVFRGFTRRQLRDAFDKCLAPGAYWKDPIRTICSAADRDLTVAAIEFHVGGPTTVTARSFNHLGTQVTCLVVTNEGYYVNIGA